MFSNTPVATHRIRNVQTKGRAPPSYLPSHPLRRVTNANVNSIDANAVPLAQSADETHMSNTVSAAIESPPPSLSRYMETHSTTLGLNGTGADHSSAHLSGSNWESALDNLDEEQNQETRQPLFTGSPSAFRRYRTTPRHGRPSLGLPERSPNITRSPIGKFFGIMEIFCSNIF